MTTAQNTASQTAREFDIFVGRKYDHIAEYLGSREGGDLTSRWMRDRKTGLIYGTGAWGRVNKAHMLTAAQIAVVEALIADAPIVSA